MVITLTGPNSFSLQQTLRTLVADFVAAEGDLALEQLDGGEATIERLSEALTSLPLLADKKMVVVRQGSANKQFMERAEALLSDLPDTTNVILVEPKLDKRAGYYKYLKKTTDFREFSELDPSGLARWLTKAATERGGSLKSTDASYLVARVGANQQLLANELDKLLLYSAQVSRQTIDALTEPTPQSTVFELLDAAFAGNAQRALALYAEQRAMKVEPQQIIAMLSWQLHIVALIKAAGQRSPEAIAGEAKISPYVIKKSLLIARKLTLNTVRQLIGELLAIDVNNKTITFSADEALQNYLVSLAS